MADHNNLGRRTVLRGSAAAVGTASTLGLAGCLNNVSGSNSANNSSSNSANNYPTDDVEIIVPFSTGGGFDAYARLTVPNWERQLNGTTVVTNVEGGGGITGMTQIYNAEPDGHTMGIYDSYQAITQQIGKNPQFDIQEMSYIGSITNTPGAFVVMESANITGWTNFVNRIEEFNFATQGAGSYAHTAPALLSSYIDGVDLNNFNFVHYNGTGEVMGGLERGEADVFYISTVTSGVEAVKSLENASLFTVFDNKENIGQYLNNNGVDTDHYSTEIGINNIAEFNQMSYDRRFFLGPPDVPDDILDAQRKAFSTFTGKDSFVDRMAENGRPVINPGGSEAVEEYITNISDTLSQDRYSQILQNVMG